MLDWLLGKPLPPGSPAPDFKLPDDSGRLVALSDLRGRYVVLVFYPADNSPRCTAQLCEFRDEWARVEAVPASVVGISPQGVESHRGFRERRRLPFPLLADAGQKVAAAYRARGPITRRTVYLIGPDGTIRYASRGKPSPADVLSHAAGGG